MDFYLSASDEVRAAFRNKVDRVLSQVRWESLGALIKSNGFDADGDALLLAEEQMAVILTRMAETQGLRLFRIGDRQRG